MKRRLTVLGIVVLNLFLLLGCGEKGEEATILANKELWKDNENLYEIPMEELEGVKQSTVYRVGDDLLFAYDTYDEEKGKSVYELKLVSIENGKLLYKNQLEPLVYGVVQVLDDGIAVNDLGDGKCYLFDSKLKEIGMYELTDGMFCLDKTGKTAYQFTYGDGIKKIDLETKNTEILLENSVNIYLCETGRDEATFVYTDTESLRRKCGVLDLQSGEISTIDSDYILENLEVGKDTWLGAIASEVPFYVLSDGETQRQFYKNISSTVGVNNASGHVMFWDYLNEGENLFLMYDNQGNLLSDCQANGLFVYQMVDFVWYEEYKGYVFTMTDEEDKAHLMFWDVSGDVIENDLDLEVVDKKPEIPSETVVSKELYDKAKELSEKYGVTILIGEQCDTEIVDHNADLLLEEADIEQALDTLDYAMGRYPEGFFKQFQYNVYQGLEIQLVGSLRKNYSTDEQVFISGGLVSHNSPYKILMALDSRISYEEEGINAVLEKTFYHEVSHVIDRRLEFGSEVRQDARYTEEGYIALNPEGFEYNDSYYGTMDPKYSHYFMGHYACTNSTEDRAMLMEEAMQGKINSFKGKEGLTNKLIYYSEGIRDNFDTTGWPEKLPWEEVLYSMKITLGE